MSDIYQPPSEPDVSEEHPISKDWVWAGHHRPACPRVLYEHMTENWDVPPKDDGVHPATSRSAARRRAIGEHFSGKTLVIPTGSAKVRANDTDFRFRPGTDFFYLTGCDEPDAVLVIAPSAAGPRSTLYVAHRRDHRTHEFFTDARYGELWVGPRRGVDEAATYYDIQTAPLDYLTKDLASLSATEVLTLRGFDGKVDAVVEGNGDDAQLGGDVERASTREGRLRGRPTASWPSTTPSRASRTSCGRCPTAQGRGERVIEGVFNLRARVEGNDVGYGTIAASGSHATILHWTRNDGEVTRGDLLLLDAGVECHEPLHRRRHPHDAGQREVHWRAASHLRARAAPPRRRASPRSSPASPSWRRNDAAMKVLAEGLLRTGHPRRRSPRSALRRDRQLHRRYTLHGVSHMLGIDVHDCANARDDGVRTATCTKATY